MSLPSGKLTLDDALRVCATMLTVNCMFKQWAACQQPQRRPHLGLA